jgi:hypothetical protein
VPHPCAGARRDWARFIPIDTASTDLGGQVSITYLGAGYWAWRARTNPGEARKLWRSQALDRASRKAYKPLIVISGWPPLLEAVHDLRGDLDTRDDRSSRNLFGGPSSRALGGPFCFPERNWGL